MSEDKNSLNTNQNNNFNLEEREMNCKTNIDEMSDN